MQEKFLSNEADIAIYGGAAGGGKTWALLIEASRHHGNAEYGAVIFRRTYPEIINQGGLWDESKKIYPILGATPNKSQLSWHFPSGAKIKFSHLQYEDDVESWQGSQIPLIIFDELTHFTERQFFYLLSRNRSLCGIKPYVRASCNPDAESWVAKFIAWWIDQESGLAIPERSGVIRWMVRIHETIHWADTAEELRVHFPTCVPKSVSFVSAKLTDNQILMRADPGYLANLLAQPLVDRERLLVGNWKIRHEPGNFFRREWFNGKMVGAAPVDARRVRYWDKAATQNGGCYTCGILMARTPDGRYFVEHECRGQWSPMVRNQQIRAMAEQDRRRYGANEPIHILEQEGGSSGRDAAVLDVTNLDGFPVALHVPSGNKEVRAKPFSSQCEAGRVFLVNDVTRPWDIDGYIDELCLFPRGFKDRVDASSGAYNRLVPWYGSPIPSDMGEDQPAAAEWIDRHKWEVDMEDVKSWWEWHGP